MTGWPAPQSARPSSATRPAICLLCGSGAHGAQYGARGERYAHIEAGHAAQNLLLAAGALGLAATPVGAFDDGEVAAALGLDRREQPFYLIPVGRS